MYFKVILKGCSALYFVSIILINPSIAILHQQRSDTSTLIKISALFFGWPKTSKISAGNAEATGNTLFSGRTVGVVSSNAGSGGINIIVDRRFGE